MAMRVALYARVSSDEQAGADRVSLPAQLRVMRERCAAEGWDVVAVFEAPGEEVLVDVTVRGGACVWVRPWAEFEGYFGERAAVVGVGRNVGPPGFEVSKEPTASGLYLARALVA